MFITQDQINFIGHVTGYWSRAVVTVDISHKTAHVSRELYT